MVLICSFYPSMKESPDIETTRQKLLKGMKYRSPAHRNTRSVFWNLGLSVFYCVLFKFSEFYYSLLQYGLPLKIVSYKDLYGWTMDDIVKAIGLKNNCTFCGVFRRQVVFTCKPFTSIFSSLLHLHRQSFSLQALDRGAALLKADKIVTGHNADDIAETVLLNILRGDIARYMLVVGHAVSRLQFLYFWFIL